MQLPMCWYPVSWCLLVLNLIAEHLPEGLDSSMLRYAEGLDKQQWPRGSERRWVGERR